MSIRPNRRRSFAALTAVGVAAAGLALVPGAPAEADPAALSLQWEISQQFDDHLSTHTYAAGATENADGVVTFPGGVSSTVGGVEQVAFEGSVRGAFSPAPGVEAYAITVADPIVTIDGTASVVTAVVTAEVGGSVVSSATRVELTTYDATTGTWGRSGTDNTLAATPRWVGVLPEGQESADLGIGAGKPVDGKSWDTGLLAHLPSSLRAHFYASGSPSDPKKAPAGFVVEQPAPTLQVTPTTTAQGISVEVAGAGFRGVTKPGDNGVYVGLAPAGGRPSTDSQADMDKFAAVAWIAKQPTPGASGYLESGVFGAVLTAAADKLDPRVRYAVYTWQAHAHSNTSQDTETPVTVDWSKLGYPVATTATATVTKKPTSTKKGSLTVAVAGGKYAATGQVGVVYKGGKLKGKKVKLVTTLTLGADGTVTVKLPKSAKGKHALTITYLGDQVHRASAATTVKVKVRK